MNPPSVGPSVGPTMMPTPNIACPIAISLGGNDSQSVAWAVESSAPPPSPWMTRQNTSASSDREAPQKNEASTNSPIEAVR